MSTDHQKDVNQNNSLNELVEQFDTIYNSLSLFKMQISTLQQQVRTIEKNVKKELKQVKSKQIITTKRAPSGFAKPTKVSKELCSFMDKPDGSEIARTEVTKTLINYIKINNLLEEGKTSKKRIVPDEKLKQLLGLNIDENEELTYFNIQKYMNKHFYSKNYVNLVA
jgi:chromatin remodeling complex protein RSC6